MSEARRTKEELFQKQIWVVVTYRDLSGAKAFSSIEEATMFAKDQCFVSRGRVFVYEAQMFAHFDLKEPVAVKV